MGRLGRPLAMAMTLLLPLAMVTLNAGALSGLPDPWPPDAQSTTGPRPPGEQIMAGQLAPSLDAVTISDVPAYRWHHGCGPTAAGMVVGYWDGQGFAYLVSGDASTQTPEVNAMIASEGPASNYSDYCEPIDSAPAPLIPDKSELPEGDEHADNCVADYMKTSQSAHDNYYGWSWFSHMAPALENWVESAGRGYEATATNYYWGWTLTWDLFRAEIDAGRPLVLLVDTNADGATDHFVTAIGYDDAEGARSYGCLNTWDDDVHWFAFAGNAGGQPWGIFGAVTLAITRELEPASYLPLVSGSR